MKRVRGPIVILRPLTVGTKEELIEEASKWRDEIRGLTLPKGKIRVIIDLLEYLILQKFPKLTIKEVERMLQLTPIEETTAGKQLLRKGKKEGKREGRKEGEKEGEKRGEQKALKSSIINLYTKANMQPENISDILEIDIKFVKLALNEADLT